MSESSAAPSAARPHFLLPVSREQTHDQISWQQGRPASFRVPGYLSDLRVTAADQTLRFIIERDPPARRASRPLSGPRPPPLAHGLPPRRLSPRLIEAML